MSGKGWTEDDRARLLARFPGYPQDDLAALANGLVGVDFDLAEEDDRSGIGVGLRTMSVDDALAEATDFEPGASAEALGYIPFAKCMYGSGNPYFIASKSGALVRIPHEAACGDRLDESMIEVVCESLAEFLIRAVRTDVDQGST